MVIYRVKMVIFLSKTPFIDVGEEPHLDSIR